MMRWHSFFEIHERQDARLRIPPTKIYEKPLLIDASLIAVTAHMPGKPHLPEMGASL
jgi:hypothetical protein